MLVVEGLTKSLGAFAMRDVGFEVRSGEYFLLVGASGVGKTVLLETLAGFLTPDRGRIVLEGRDITYERIRNRPIGLVYQDQALFPHLTVYDNVAYGLRQRKLGRRAVRDRIGRTAETVGISHLLKRYPGTLSGGEAQRVALARAIVIQPRCMLLDEPLSSVDSQARAQLRGLLRTLNREGLTIIHVTHDYEEAISLASRVAIMEGGRIAQTDEPAEVFRHPRSEFVASFIGIRNIYKGRLSYVNGSSEPAAFKTEGGEFFVLSDAPAGDGMLMLRSEDIALSPARPEGSALNCFEGVIVDIGSARLGVEVTVDIGTRVTSMISRKSMEKLGLGIGGRIWVSFKASAARFLPE